MTNEQLQQLISLGEGFTLEFKQNGTTHLGRELCAFANATGGVVLIGVADDGQPVGVREPNRLKSEVQNIARSIEPPLVIDLEVVENILVIQVPAQNSKPYSSGGKFYLRDGASSQQMSRDEIREFFFKEGVIHFDETPCSRFNLKKDLTDSVWRRFRQRAGIPADMEPRIALENLHLFRDGKMTHAGAWLLATDITKFNVSANVACALFLGTDKVRILDRKDFSGDVYSMIDDVISYILSKINTELIIKRLKREQRPEFPEPALREAVVNALVHRDYRSSANVQIYIFQDRVEIVSPGGLPAGMTVAGLGTKSIPRNPLLFGLLYRMNAVEHIGSGIRRIRNLCRDYGVAEPRIDVSDHWFNMTFLRPGDQSGNGQPESEVQAEAQEAQVEAQEAQVALQKWEVAMLRMCARQDATGTELLEAAGYSSRTGNFKRGLEKLLDSRLLEMTIPDKPRSSKQKYRLTDKGREMLGQRER